MNNQSRRTFLKLMGTGGMAAAFGYSMASQESIMQAPSRKPNVIFIYTDDQTFDHFGVFGGKALTPNIDSLATDGMTLTRFYITSPVCTPSRFSTITGQYANRSRAFQRKRPPDGPCSIGWNTPLSPREKTIAHVLKSAGYTTGMVGKWHLGKPSSLSRLPRNADSADPGVSEKLRSNYESTQQWIKSNYGFDYAESIYSQNISSSWLPAALCYHNMDWVTSGALDFIEQNRDKPFFLYMAPTLAHESLNATKEIDALESLKSDPRITPAGMLPKAPDVQPSRQNILDRVKSKGFSEHSAVYTWIDDGVGAVLRKLKDLGIENNTVVMFVPDHGVRGKYTCYDSAARVPFLLKWPGKIAPGSGCDELTANLDIAPTIFDLCGATPPPGMTLDGKSFLPLLNGEKAPWRDSLLLEIASTRAVVTKEWKYLAVRFSDRTQGKVNVGNRRNFAHDGGTKMRYNADQDFPGYFDDDQLYNLKEDILEQHNLAGDPAKKNQLEKMRELMRRHSKKIPHTFGEFS